MANNRVIAVDLGHRQLMVRINKKVGRLCLRTRCLFLSPSISLESVSTNPQNYRSRPTKIVSSNISHYVVVTKLLPRRTSSAYNRPLRSHRSRRCWKHLQTAFFHRPLYYPCLNTAQVRRAQAAKHLQVWPRRGWQCPLQLGTRHLLF